jgi:NAD(P)-dependent dehydrogenase (short-subunit alcohol dehydrogenase family)
VKKVLVFGATGFLGSSCVNKLNSQGWEVISFGRELDKLIEIDQISAVVWAQGANHTGSIMETKSETWMELWDANVGFIVKGLQILLKENILASGARLVILGSVWQNVARSNKTAYITSKSALTGLVRGLAVEFGPLGISINGVLPGVVESEMTRKNLSPDQIEKIVTGTPGHLLITAEQVANIVTFLLSKDSNGINGQSIVVDNGWTISRDV